jgi:predicted aconitase with swiveling domain
MNNFKDNSKIIGCKKIVGGMTKGKIQFSEQPINFLAMLDVKTGQIVDPFHKLNNQSLKGNILVFPNAIGSSVGAYTIFSLKKNNTSPKGIICTNSVDITTASGCAISNIPLVYINNEEFKQFCKYYDGITIERRSEIILDADNENIIFDSDNKSI